MEVKGGLLRMVAISKSSGSVVIILPGPDLGTKQHLQMLV